MLYTNTTNKLGSVLIVEDVLIVVDVSIIYMRLYSHLSTV